MDAPSVSYKLKIILSEIIDNKEHEDGGINFYISYTGPLGGFGGNKQVKVDISKKKKEYKKKQLRRGWEEREKIKFFLTTHTFWGVFWKN